MMSEVKQLFDYYLGEIKIKSKYLQVRTTSHHVYRKELGFSPLCHSPVR
jgi:hypothetical protein